MRCGFLPMGYKKILFVRDLVVWAEKSYGALVFVPGVKRYEDARTLTSLRARRRPSVIVLYYLRKAGAVNLHANARGNF
jgi:hypothetical protein